MQSNKESFSFEVKIILNYFKFTNLSNNDTNPILSFQFMDLFMKWTSLYIVIFIFFNLYGEESKHFVIVIPSYNNHEWCIKNLESVFTQNYSNYEIIYIDDHSLDGTGDLVEDYILSHPLGSKVTLIKNKNRQRALANHYKAGHMCSDDIIIVQLDGDDWFAHEKVLSHLNTIYADPKVWITYGQFISWPTNVKGYCRPLSKRVVRKRLFRETFWYPGQLRTFYTWLFKKVKQEDLMVKTPGQFEGGFFPTTYDLALYYPMMEMAGNHYKFISDIIYVRNVKTPFNDFKVNRSLQVMCETQLKKQTKYSTL